MCGINLQIIICAIFIIDLNVIQCLKRTSYRHGDNRRNIIKRDVNQFVSDSKKSAVLNKRDVIDFVPWTHSQVLDKNGNIILRWQPRHQEISFRVEAKTKGYIGIGFSPNGGMEGADIVIGWIDDNDSKAYLLDCHGVSKDQGSAPVKDASDNYTLMRGVQNDTHTILEFRRALDTCDPDDYILGSDTVRVIWALHDRDPRNSYDLVYHENERGSQSLHLLGRPPVPKSNVDENVRYWDVTLNNFEVKNDMNTIYWCKIFKAPNLRRKHHVIGYEPILGVNHTSLVHHMLLHECVLDANEDMKKWEKYVTEDGRACYSDTPLEWEKCLQPIVAWAVGSEGENYPKHVGIPISEHPNTFYKLEIHFDNPSMTTAIDTTGLRMHYTNKLRDNEAGILVTGVTLSPLHIIPPEQNEYKSAGYCSMDCTKKAFPRDGINVVSVLLHSHLAGRKLKLRHIRGTKELLPLAQDDKYDFNYQQSRALSLEVKVLPGDALVTECSYYTKNRNKTTFGGYSTKQEMCLAFVLHYPKTEIAGCYSMPPIKYFFETIGIQQFYDKNMTEVEKLILQGSLSESVSSTSTQRAPLFSTKPGDEYSIEANQRAILAIQNAKDYTIENESNQNVNFFERLVIKEPLEFRNKTFMSHLDNMPFEESVAKQIEQHFYKGLHLTFCRKNDDTLAIKETVERFPTFSPYVETTAKIQCSHRRRYLPTNYANQSSKLYNSSTRLITYLLLFFYYFSMRRD